MSWEVFAVPFYNNGDLETTDVSQSLICSEQKVLLAVRSWFVFFGSPSFNELKMRIHKSTANVLVAESINSYVLDEIKTEDYAVKEIHFEFDKISFSKNCEYRFSLYSTGYVATANNHIAWRVDYPNPVYPVDFSEQIVRIGRYPLTLCPVVARFDFN